MEIRLTDMITIVNMRNRKAWPVMIAYAISDFIIRKQEKESTGFYGLCSAVERLNIIRIVVRKTDIQQELRTDGERRARSEKESTR